VLLLWRRVLWITGRKKKKKRDYIPNLAVADSPVLRIAAAFFFPAGGYFPPTLVEIFSVGRDAILKFCSGRTNPGGIFLLE
jgi:hypothetical protein